MAQRASSPTPWWLTTRSLQTPWPRTLPPCTLPGSPGLASQRQPAACHPGPPRSSQAQPAPPGTRRNLLPYRQHSLEPHANQIPQHRKRGFGVARRHGFGNYQGDLGICHTAQGLSPVPPNPQPHTAPPGRALLPQLTGCRPGKRVARSLPFPFHPGQSCAWARKVKKAKDRPSLRPLPRWGGRARPPGCGRGCRRDAGGPVAAPYQLHIDLPAGSLL